ncbi:hypothetical protein NEMBOFW57_005102 [Staphylotrichum longicolle]|uniref:25S rRNA (Uridine(2843)-N(3))-methyltransferase n=1 Tax=Staphylotrichum longicolle TaxID=669026 RepID=A0AAD4EWQ1_9PEZI|nr:hypothetical protein NEMBOFW57_005102 [Staphylotrichum longicolle]
MTGKKRNNTTKPKKQPHKNHVPTTSTDTQNEADQKQLISDGQRKHQQRVLDVFRHAFGDALSSPNLTATLQSVKQALYDRDFARAFGDPEHLAVYAARWSPTRALCYASVLDGIMEYLEPLLSSSSVDTTSQSGNKDGDDEEAAPLNDAASLKVLSIGGGAAELVAFGAFLNQHFPLSGSIALLDSGPWDTVVSQLTTALTTPPPISKYANAAAKLSNAAMVPSSYLHPTFLQQDVLALDKAGVVSLLGTTPLLVTILFTLNELFTAGGIRKTTTFLLDMTSTIPLGSLLLVVDSPGSYSEATVGKEAKRYPMQWVLDKVLLSDEAPTALGRQWIKVESHDSVWFRLASEALDYPIPLENMRYQMHLYRMVDASSDDN